MFLGPYIIYKWFMNNFLLITYLLGDTVILFPTIRRKIDVDIDFDVRKY